MKCIRCKKEFDDYIPERNVECTGDTIYFSCPHCGKLYKFFRIVAHESVNDEEIEDCGIELDDWENKIILDKDFK